MTPQHTQTPWYCEGDAIYDNPECTGNPIAHVLSCAYGADDNAVDARRIVACVNACEGISTNALQRMPSPFSEMLSLDFNLMVNQRDQLLTELEKTLDYLEHKGKALPFLGSCLVLKDCVSSGRAAIAAVKGEFGQVAGRAPRKLGVTFIIPPGMSADELKASIERANANRVAEVSTDWPLRGAGEKGSAPC